MSISQPGGVVKTSRSNARPVGAAGRVPTTAALGGCCINEDEVVMAGKQSKADTGDHGTAAKQARRRDRDQARRQDREQRRRSEAEAAVAAAASAQAAVATLEAQRADLRTQVAALDAAITDGRRRLAADRALRTVTRRAKGTTAEALERARKSARSADRRAGRARSRLDRVVPAQASATAVPMDDAAAAAEAVAAP
jgi:hypothetical protein